MKRGSNHVIAQVRSLIIDAVSGRHLVGSYTGIIRSMRQRRSAEITTYARWGAGAWSLAHVTDYPGLLTHRLQTQSHAPCHALIYSTVSMTKLYALT